MRFGHASWNGFHGKTWRGHWKHRDEDTDDGIRHYVRDTRPILGGATSVSLSSASVLQSLGITVSPLGSAKIETSHGDPVARFAITGGTDGKGRDADVILHQGSGLSLSSHGGTIELRDFRIDTRNDAVFADVTVNGTTAGNLQVFDLASGGALTLTSAAAEVVAATLDAPAITSDVVIGAADPDTIVGLASLIKYCKAHDNIAFLASPDTKPVISGETSVALTAAATLQSLQVSIAPLGSGSIDTSGVDPVAKFAITGGTLAPEDTGSILLHEGSGLELVDSDSRIGLRDLVIDTQNKVVSANVTVDHTSLGSVQVFDLGSGGALLLREVAADVLREAFEAPAITAGLQIGVATPSPTAWHGKGDLWQNTGWDRGCCGLPSWH